MGGMKEGFSNFDKVHKKELLAVSDGKQVSSAFDGRVFMPLYQSMGDDGFFIVREVSPFWLWLSAQVRFSPLQNLLRWLPGVQTLPDHKFEIDDTLVERRLIKQLFHLFGYMVKKTSDNKFLLVRRENVKN